MYIRRDEMASLGKVLTTLEYSVVQRLRNVIARYNAMKSTPRDTEEARAIEREISAITNIAQRDLPMSIRATVGNALLDAAVNAERYRTESTVISGFKTLKDRMKSKIKAIIEMITEEPEAISTKTTPIVTPESIPMLSPAPGATITPAPTAGSRLPMKYIIPGLVGVALVAYLAYRRK